VFRPPADPNTSVLAFSTGDYYDERASIQGQIEQSITRGSRSMAWLWGPHLRGMRAITLWQRLEVELPRQSARLELVAKSTGSGGTEQYSQFVWLTSITHAERVMYDSTGRYVVREVVCELAEGLSEPFTGIEPNRIDPTIASVAALVYNTRYNADSFALHGIQPLATAAAVNDYRVRVDSLYAPLIPTSFTETALPDVNPGGNSPALVEANSDTIEFTTTLEIVKPDASLYLGSGAAPGTIRISVSGGTLTDSNGMMIQSDAEVGTVDYGNGIIRWNSSVANYGTSSKTITFRPAVKTFRIADTAAQMVTLENRGFVWVLTLAPIPAPQTLTVSYRVNNVWYVLSDQGSGILAGVDSSYGAGTLNFQTGTVTITTGAMPDVDSEILYAWATPVNYTKRGNSLVDAPTLRGQTATGGIQAGSVSIVWAVGGTTYTVDDDPDADGILTGDGDGEIRYDTGEWVLRPTLLPPVNTEFVVNYSHYSAEEVTEEFVDPLLDPDGNLHLELASGAIAPGSVRITLPVESQEVTGSYVDAYDNTEELWFAPNIVGAVRALVQSEQSIQNESGSYTTAKVTGTMRVRDDANGLLVVRGGTNGTADYGLGVLDFKPETETPAIQATTESKEVGSRFVDPVGGERGEMIKNYRETVTDYTTEVVPAAFISGQGTVTVSYRLAGSSSAASDTMTLSQLRLDLTRGYGETITAGSTRFKIGADTFVDTAGQLYRNPSPETGAGSLSGTLDRTTGVALINQWSGGIANTVTLQALTTELAGQPIDECVFRTPVSPLKPGTLQVRYTTIGGAAKSKTVDSSGNLEDADCKITVNYPLGIVRIRFGLWKVDADLTPAEKLETWYNPDSRVDIAGVLKIWKPAMVAADSIIYNAVAQTFLPPDSELLGLNAARLPPDGKGLIYQVGRLVLVHHTDTLAQSNLSPTQVIDCGRVRLYRVAIDDAGGQRLPASFYSVNRELGTVTMAANLDLTGYTGPYTVSHTVADLARLAQTDINGTLTLNKPVSHDYPADESYASGVLYIGDLQARYTNLFAQATWTNVWSDSRIGDAPLAQYNDTAYPVVVSNLGAYKDRLLIKFTSATAFQVIGENLGVIGVGNITQDCAPVNQLTGQPYFTLDYRGWGAGWATGNCVRFNLIGANYPIDLIRAIQPSTPSGLEDEVELLFIGNTDAP
jgi:hypothetical protein